MSRAGLTNHAPQLGGRNRLPVNVSESWRVSLQAEETINDSDKTFTVPASTEWQVLWVWVELTTDATVGNRQMAIEIQDSASDVIAQFVAGTVQSASLARNYLFGSGVVDLFDFRDTVYLSTPIPGGLFLSPGQKLRVFDSKAIAAAGDDMIVQMQIAARAI